MLVVCIRHVLYTGMHAPERSGPAIPGL